MIGQLQDVGNTTTLANYLALLGAAWMLTGLDKFAGDLARSRSASPKLQVLNTALMAAQLPQSFAMARQEGELWGRLVESAVGAHLLNTAPPGIEITYWRERNQEVDFVLRQGDSLLPIEVKSGRNKGALSGLRAFAESFKTGDSLLVGTGGVPLEQFLTVGAEEWMGARG
jgi:predicted AAA+ superfamily ATPase